MRAADRVYLCYTRATRPTGKNMARELGLPSFGIRPPREAVDVMIRWGSRRPMPPTEMTLNKPEAIANAADKMRAFALMSDAGVSVPPVFTSYAAAYNYHGGVIFGRSTHGFGGKDIAIYKNPREYQGQQHDFYVPYFQSVRELRLHVVGDKIIRVQGKYHDYPEHDKSEGYIRNHENGYRFRSPRLEIRSTRKANAITAVKSLGLDFGAVDMLLTGNNSCTVLEVNTAPSCSPLTLRCYAGELALLIEQKSGGEIRLAPDLLEVEDDWYDEEDE